MEAPVVPPVNPTKLPFEATNTRRRIIASYWLVVLLSIPLWWQATSIERLSLPVAKVTALDTQSLRFPLRFGFKSDFSSISIDSLQKEMSDRLSPRAYVESVPAHVTESSVPGLYNVIIESGAPAMYLRDRQLHVRSNEDTVNTRRAVLDTLENLISPQSDRTGLLRVVRYSPRYRLAFSLLNEDASSGTGVTTWEVRAAIQRHLTPTLNKLSVLHNFTIESQVQYHAPLAFGPKHLQLEDKNVHGLTPEDLTVFINSAEWTLSSSVSNDPVIHFVLFVPSSQNNPLYILNADGTPSSSDAFILPQWGGISILNNAVTHLSVAALDHTFDTFRHQLLSLLGVPALPPSIEYDRSQPFTDWQLDALVRLRTRQNIDGSKETLKSIVALVDQIENMPVGQDVKGDVQAALNALDMVFAEGSSSLMLALRHSSEALTRASRAFFDPGMLALLYFPAEHKYAVYTPLFASVAAPLVAAIIREVAAWRKARKERTQARRDHVDRVKTD